MTQTNQNSTKKISFYILAILLLSTFSGLVSVYLLNTDFGSVSVSTVNIPNGNNKLTGWLYQPNDLLEADSLPTVILAHGFSGSKYSMSGLALEISRRGFVALALDLIGHGNSDPANESTLGIRAAIEYLDSLSYTNISSLGIVGHSMGAGAAYATVLEYQNISATVLIGLVGLRANSDLLKDFNATFPRNLLIAMGEYDEFYSDVSKLSSLLMPVFGTTSPVIPNHVIYGNFVLQDARKLVISKTNHILETVDPQILSETIAWLQNSLKSVGTLDEYYIIPSNLIFTFREIFSLGTFVSLLGLAFSLIFFTYDTKIFSREEIIVESDFFPIDLFKSGFLWGVLIILFFIPMSLIGSFLPFPPIIFGSSIGLWFLAVNISTLLILSFFPKYFGIRKDFKSILTTSLFQPNAKYGIFLACCIILVLYLFLFFLGFIFSIQLGFVVGILGNILVLPRLIGFFSLLPLFVIFFLIDGLVFNSLIIPVTGKLNLKDEIINLAKLLLIKGAPFFSLTFIVYFLKIFLGIHLLPSGTFALLFQFYWVIGIFLMVGTAITYLWYRASHSVVPGTIFTSLLFVWILVTILPVQ